MIKYRCIYFIWLFFLTILNFTYADDNGKLTFGILPYLSPSKLMDLHKPMKDYLASEIAQGIEFVSAPDFKIFNERCKEYYYDIIFTAPHMARFLELNFGYQRIVMTLHNGHALFLTKKNI